VLSAALRKSITDLTRRRSRAFFTVATLAIAVASVGLLALAPLTDREMRDEVTATRLAHLTIWTQPVDLRAADMDGLRAIENVAAVEPRSTFVTRAYVGQRRAEAIVVGVRDFADQHVDVVAVASGTAPGSGAVLTDVQNARQGAFAAAAGDEIRIIAADGSVQELSISGEGRNLDWGQEVVSEGTIVLYATPQTVAALSGDLGFGTLAFRLRDTRRAEVDRTIAAVQEHLTTVPGFVGFTELPEVRQPGAWPGKEELEDYSRILYVITILALLSGLVLVSNTMTALVGEQTGEIGTMKALGARRRQIAAIYLRTAFLLGALGTLVGAVLGVLLANGLVRFFGSEFFAIETGFGVDVPVVLGSIALGVLGPAVAALPAIRRGASLSVREAIGATGSSVVEAGTVDQALRRVGFLPRTAQIGLRNAGRRRRRSAATVLQVGFAVATMLAVLGLASGATETTRASWRDHGWDIAVGGSARTPLDALAGEVIRSTPGVAGAEAVLMTEIELDGHDAFVWATSAETLFRYRIVEGRWYGSEDESAQRRVGVIERKLADTAGVGVGDSVDVTTPAGPVTFRIIGVSANQQEAGDTLFVPRETLREILPAPDAFTSYWVKVASNEHGQIDSVTTLVEDALTRDGYEVGTEITYVATRDEEATNRTLTTTIAVLGFLIIALSMVGLVGATTMSILERTREVGTLRCIGARARDIRRIFATEGFVLALLGWLLGIPFGYGLDHLLVWLIEDQLGIDLLFAFPLRNLPLALAGTIALALLVMLLPLHRAVRLRPGDAVRYA
jgi:putative ABC transport system permease protein